MEAARPVRRAGRRNPLDRKSSRALRSDPYTYVPHQIRDGLRVLHRRRVLPADRRLAGRVEHDAPTWSSTRSRWHDAHAAAGDLIGLVTHSRRRVAIHVRAVHRASRRDRRPTIDRHDRRLVTTTPSPRRRTGSTRPSASTGPTPRDRGTTSTNSNSPRSSWVHWFNDDRLHSHCGDVPPAEFEAAFYAAQQTAPAGVGNQ